MQCHSRRLTLVDSGYINGSNYAGANVIIAAGVLAFLYFIAA